MSQLAPLQVKDLPEPPKFRQLLGPSFIFLGLGLGSGELILWPYLVANWGLGIIWGAVLGITFQFFMNMEIERYALVNGESVFVGWARKWRWLPLWFLISSFVPWIWPGIIAAAAAALGAVFGWQQTHWLAIILMILAGLILTLGPVLYQVQETAQKWLVILGAPLILGLALLLADPSHWQALGQGLLGVGDTYRFLPAGIPLAVFLAAVAYSGAGGNLNLAQSYYVREKGYGMGRYLGRITSLLTVKPEPLQLTGATFAINPLNLARYRHWWKLINWEHGLIFWAAGLITILLVALLAQATTYGLPNTQTDINFVITQAAIISQKLLPVAGTLFLLVVGLMLFATQLAVIGSTSRILAENVLLLWPNLSTDHWRSLFYSWLWLQIAAGSLVLLSGFRQPLALITLGAILNALAMWVHSGLTLWLNTTSLPQVLRPNWRRRIILSLAFTGFGALSLSTFLWAK